jgi:hypothetical protein
MEDDCPELWAEAPRSRLALRVELLLDDVRLDEKSGMLKRAELIQEPTLSDLLIFRFSQMTNYVLEPAQTARILALWAKKKTG